MTETERLLREFDKKAKRFAIIKSIICACIVGFGINFVLAFILWFVNIGLVALLLLSIGAGLACGVTVGFALYFVRFKPSAKTVIRMVDSLGLDERIVTMYEMENNKSEIARLQREDAFILFTIRD